MGSEMCIRDSSTTSSGHRDGIIDEENGPCHIDFSLFAMDPATVKRSRVRTYEQRAISREKRDAKKPKRKKSYRRKRKSGGRKKRSSG